MRKRAGGSVREAEVVVEVALKRSLMGFQADSSRVTARSTW